MMARNRPLVSYRDTRASFSSLLNWAICPAPGVIGGKDGSWMASWWFRGEDNDAATPDQLETLSQQLNIALRRFGNGWMLNVDVIRSESIGYPSHVSFPDKISFLIDQERRVHYHREATHFDSRYVVSLTYLPPRRRGRLFEFFYSGDKDPQTTYSDAAVERLWQGFQAKIVDFERSLAGVGRIQRMLPYTVRTDDGATATFDPQLSYLEYCVSGRWRPVRLPEIPMFVDEVIARVPLVTGFRPRIGRNIVATVAIDGYPASSTPGVLTALDRLGMPYRWATRFIALDRDDAQSVMKKFQRYWSQKKTDFRAQIAGTGGIVDRDAAKMDYEIGDALEDLSRGGAQFGFYTSSVVIMGRDEEEVEVRAGQVVTMIENLGFGARLEEGNTVESYLGSLPGHAGYNVRRPVIHTMNVADFFPGTAIWCGPETHPCRYYNGGPPLMWADTVGSTPFRICLHVGDLGHTLVIGASRGGKSFLKNALAVQHLRYPAARVIDIDVGFSSEAICSAVGGTDYTPLSGNLRFCPFAHIGDAAELLWTAEWIEQLCELDGVHISPTQRRRVIEALERLKDQPERCFSTFLAELQDPDRQIKRLLAHYTMDGPLGELFDGQPGDEPSEDAHWIRYELKLVREASAKALRATQLYLVHRVTRLIRDNRPTLVAIDEAWLWLQDPIMGPVIETWSRTAAVQNCAIVLCTQSISEIAECPFRGTLLANFPTRIFTPNRNAGDEGLRELYEKMFGFNEAEIDILRFSVQQRDYFFRSSDGRRRFSLAAGPLMRAFLGVSGQDLDTIRSLIAEHGESWPVRWMEMLGLTEWVEAYHALVPGDQEADDAA